MATQFPLAPTAGQTFELNGTIYSYNAALGWVVPTTGVTTPAAPTTYTRGTAQFTDDAFGFRQVFDNIYDAYQNNTGVFRNPQNGNPNWDVTTYDTANWGGLFMINVSPTNTGNPNLIIDVPAGAVGGIMWLRFISNDVTTARENTITYRAAGSGEAGETFVGTWADNQSQPIRFGPSGYMEEAGTENSINHFWHPFVLPDGATQIEVEIRSGTGWNSPDGWVSGLAFTDNPRGWALTNAITLHRQGAGFFYQNSVPFQWGGVAGGFSRARFQGRHGDNETTAVTNNAAGPKRFPVQCDINGNDKKVVFMAYHDDMNILRQPPHLRALNGTWISPEESKKELDWVTINLTKNPVWTYYWMFEIPAAEIAAAAAVNIAGGALDTAVMLEMFSPSSELTDFAHIFTYDA